jgi:hypothetical protein
MCSLAHRFRRIAPATLNRDRSSAVTADRGGPLDGPQSRKRHWFQAEVHCLQCGRLVGRVLGPVAAGCTPRWPQVAGPALFRPVGPNRPVRALAAIEHFRCTVCGGSGVVEELEVFTTYNFEFDDDRPRRGRRPKMRLGRQRDPRLAEFGIGV